MKWASRRSIARARTPTKMERNPAHKSMGLGCLAALALSTVQRTPSNVAADECALPVNLCHSRIGAFSRLGDGRAGGRNIQDTAAHRHDIGAAPLCSGMKQGDAGQ